MIHVRTMIGLGDALAARPTIAALLRKDSLAIETPWPEVFEDLIRNRYCGPSESVFLRPKNLNIRCAKRNSGESKLYADENSDMVRDCVGGLRRIQLSYSLHKGCKSIPEQIAESAGVPTGAPTEHHADPNIHWDDFFIERCESMESCYCHERASPLGVFRVPTIRTEYKNAARNPAPGLVAAAVDEIGGDWLHLNDYRFCENDEVNEFLAPGESYPADYGDPGEVNQIEAIHGELSLPSMLDLVSRARCVVTPCSWMLWAAAAFQVPTLALFGGYAPARTIMGPILDSRESLTVLEPDPFCACFSPVHQCRKEIPVEKVREAALKLKGG